VLQGDPGRPEVWQVLTALLTESWASEAGPEIRLKGLTIDSGYATQEVYAWVRTQSPALMFAVKGVERGAALVGLPTAVDATLNGKRLRGAKVRVVASGMAKLEPFNNLRKAKPAAGEPCPGYVHLPRVDAEYVMQLCAEQLVTVHERHGYARREWHKLRERNEALDCYVYARATAAVVGLDRMTEARWAAIEKALGPAPRPTAITPPAPAAPQPLEADPPQRPRRLNPFTNRREGDRHWLGSIRELRN
jgi:phage terminase large subunit GpA-like protein